MIRCRRVVSAPVRSHKFAEVVGVAGDIAGIGSIAEMTIAEVEFVVVVVVVVEQAVKAERRCSKTRPVRRPKKKPVAAHYCKSHNRKNYFHIHSYCLYPYPFPCFFRRRARELRT